MGGAFAANNAIIGEAAQSQIPLGLMAGFLTLLISLCLYSNARWAGGATAGIGRFVLPGLALLGGGSVLAATSFQSTFNMPALGPILGIVSGVPLFMYIIMWQCFGKYSNNSGMGSSISNLMHHNFKLTVATFTVLPTVLGVGLYTGFLGGAESNWAAMAIFVALFSGMLGAGCVGKHAPSMHNLGKDQALVVIAGLSSAFLGVGAVVGATTSWNMFGYGAGIMSFILPFLILSMYGCNRVNGNNMKTRDGLIAVSTVATFAVFGAATMVGMGSIGQQLPWSCGLLIGVGVLCLVGMIFSCTNIHKRCAGR